MYKRPAVIAEPSESPGMLKRPDMRKRPAAVVTDQLQTLFAAAEFDVDEVAAHLAKFC